MSHGTATCIVGGFEPNTIHTAWTCIFSRHRVHEGELSFIPHPGSWQAAGSLPAVTLQGVLVHTQFEDRGAPGFLLWTFCSRQCLGPRLRAEAQKPDSWQPYQNTCFAVLPPHPVFLKPFAPGL